MSREMLSSISEFADAAAYATPELASLFNDWLGEIEKEALAFLDGRGKADPAEVARHLRLKRESTVYILNKLAGEGRIDMSVSGA